MDWKKEYKPFVLIAGVFLAFYSLPFERLGFDNSLMEALLLAQSYAREHVLLCLVPAFFIAGAITVFLSQASVMKYLGPSAGKVVAYSVASVSGSVLAVCSCTVLPLFAGIYRMGAGLGPAAAFLYAGPAINILAIILTARVLGPELGLARAIGAVVFSVVIGLLMHVIFRREEEERHRTAAVQPEGEEPRPLGRTVLYFGSMVAILVFANWGRPVEASGLWQMIYGSKWWQTLLGSASLGLMLVLWFGLPWRKLLAAAGLSLGVYIVYPHSAAVFSAGVVGLV
jgi:uncharacterized membrane protein YraQ (UPF0718 family)